MCVSVRRALYNEAQEIEAKPMTKALQVKTTVLPGHRIEIQSPELPEGTAATVIVVLDEAAQSPKLPWSEIVKGYPGGKLFKTAKEVDDYIREERDSWEK